MKFREKQIELVLWWDIKTSNIEYHDIQYAAGRTISQKYVKENLDTAFFTENEMQISPMAMGMMTKFLSKAICKDKVRPLSKKGCIISAIVRTFPDQRKNTL